MNEYFDTIIIGAGTAGLTAAIYTARSERSVLVLESSSIGGQISTSPLVENYPGFMNMSGMEFSEKLYEQATALGVKISFEDVTKIETVGNDKYVYSDDNKRSCKKIIIASGQKPRKLGVENEEKLTGIGVSYCAICDGPFYKNKTVAVAGGGNAALQSVRLLAGICKKVYMIHRRDTFRGERIQAGELEKMENIEFVLNSNITELSGDKKLTGITVKNTQTNQLRQLEADGLFISVGHTPNSDIFKGLIDLDEYGYIIAAEDCKTNINGIYAAGDCRKKTIRQLTTAAADGTVAAMAE